MRIEGARRTVRTVDGSRPSSIISCTHGMQGVTPTLSNRPPRRRLPNACKKRLPQGKRRGWQFRLPTSASATRPADSRTRPKERLWAGRSSFFARSRERDMNNRVVYVCSCHDGTRLDPSTAMNIYITSGIHSHLHHLPPNHAYAPGKTHAVCVEYSTYIQ